MAIERAIAVLDRALGDHQIWAGRLHRSLIAGMPPAEDDLLVDAHHRCAFGRWYDQEAEQPRLGLGGLPAFEEIGRIHVGMHDQARALLSAVPSDARLVHYDRFSAASDQLAVAVRELRQMLLMRLLCTDPLTGLPGRRNMEERLTLEWQQLQKVGHPAVIAMMDLDHFKQVNDVHGHTAGDRVLRWVGAGARHQLRAHDLVFRYGGEEFVALLGDSTLDAALGTVERIRRVIESAPIDLPGGGRARVTASFGLSPCAPELSIRETIARADQALYEAKRSGRNRVICWRPEGLA